MIKTKKKEGMEGRRKKAKVLRIENIRDYYK
jgi:hypothetical protein